MAFTSGFGGFVPRANMAQMVAATKMKGGGTAGDNDNKNDKKDKRRNWFRRLIHFLFKKP